jgi:hypothetical protein
LLAASFVSSVNKKIIEQTIAGFADHFTSKELSFTHASGDEITVRKLNTAELCLDDVCVTKSRLQTLLNGASTAAEPATASSTAAADTLPAASDAPSIVPSDVPTGAQGDPTAGSPQGASQ